MVFNMKTIEFSISKNNTVIIDADDAWVLEGNKWCSSGKPGRPYVLRKTNGKYESLHRLIMNAGRGQVVDHINGNTLDNRRQNLRIATVQQNSWNRVGPNKTKKYKGVHYIERLKKYSARLTVSGKNLYLVFTRPKRKQQKHITTHA